MVAPTKRQSFNNGTQGASVDATSSAGSGDAIGAPIVAGDGAAVFDTASAVYGSKGCKVNGGSGATYTMPLTITANDSAGLAASFRSDSSHRPTSGSWVIGRLRSASANAAIVVMNTAGVVIVQDAAGSGKKNLNGNAALPDGDYTICVAATKGTGTTDGTIKAYLRRKSDDTLVDSYTATNVNAGTAQITNAQFGKPTSGDVLPAGGMVVDEIAIVAGSTSEIDRPTLTAPTAFATVTATTVDAYSTFVIDASGSTGGSGTITATSLQQTAGTAAEFSGSWSTFTITAPGTVAGDTLTFEVRVTNDLGDTSAPYLINVTVLAVTDLFASGGEWVPMQKLLLSS